MTEEVKVEKKKFEVWGKTKDFASFLSASDLKEQKLQIRYLSNIIRKQVIDSEKAKFKERLKKI